MNRDYLLAIGLVAIALAVFGCPQKRSTGKSAQASPDAVKITQFYAVSGVIAPGEATRLCYGLENARAVRMEPPVEGVRPALSRCVEISPRTPTTYTLIAEGAAGAPASATVTVRVDARRHASPLSTARAAEPKAAGASFFADRQNTPSGQPVLLCYQTGGASKVEIAPRSTSGELPVNGCLTERPTSSTTYVLTAEYPGGRRDRQSVKIKVE